MPIMTSHKFHVYHTVSLPFSQSHRSFFISRGFTNFEQIFSRTHSFLRKQTQTTNSNAAEEHMIFYERMFYECIKQVSLSLSGALLLIMSVKTHFDNPIQMETTTRLIEKSEKIHS